MSAARSIVTATAITLALACDSSGKGGSIDGGTDLPPPSGGSSGTTGGGTTGAPDAAGASGAGGVSAGGVSGTGGSSGSGGATGSIDAGAMDAGGDALLPDVMALCQQSCNNTKSLGCATDASLCAGVCKEWYRDSSSACKPVFASYLDCIAPRPAADFICGCCDWVLPKAGVCQVERQRAESCLGPLS